MLDRVMRRAALVRSHPLELVDRLRNKVEFKREPPSTLLGHEEVRARARQRFGYQVAEDPRKELHEALDLHWPCSADAAFARELDELASDIGEGHGLDGDETFVHVLYCLATHLRAERVVETGVARGVSSRFLLSAFEAMGQGHLWSIDLPPLAHELDDQSGLLVPQRLRDSWTYLRGSSRRRLPSLLRELGQIDIFVHDSQHTERNMNFELELAWRYVRAGGVVVSDDIHENGAFKRLLDRTGAPSVIGQESVKAGFFGVAFKH